MLRKTMRTLFLGVGLAGVAGCSPGGGKVSSTTAANEPAGANCAAGGVVVRSGVDADGDGVVSATEATSTHYLCNGAAGAAGAAGDAGVPGIATLNKVVAEPAGANCALGGYALENGADDNGNGLLDASEVDSTQYLCTSAAPEHAVLLSRTYVGNPDAACPGGYVRVGFGADTDDNGTLSAAEQTGSFLGCNSLPRVTSGPIDVTDCTASPIVLPITSTDVDGTVTQISAAVATSASPLSLSTGANGQIQLAPGAHVARATLDVTLTDNDGATVVVPVTVIFSGTGCVPLDGFNGVVPWSCTAIEVNPQAGDDRSGPVLTGQYVYYNGDDGLVRTDMNLGHLQQIVPTEVDGLLGDAVQGKLYSLWSSTWDALPLEDGGTFAITGLADQNASGLFEDYGSSGALDQLALIDEVTLQPTSRVTLPLAISVSPVTFDVGDGDGGVVTVNQNQTMVSATDGQALIARFGSTNDGAHGALYQLVDVSTGALTLSRELYWDSTDSSYGDYEWDTQEDSIQHYALIKRGAQYVVTYRASSGWVELELSAGQPVVRNTTFAYGCDTYNLALSADLTTVIFHSEGSYCFGYEYDELLLRCDALFTPNPSGAVDDSGGN